MLNDIRISCKNLTICFLISLAHEILWQPAKFPFIFTQFWNGINVMSLSLPLYESIEQVEDYL